MKKNKLYILLFLLVFATKGQAAAIIPKLYLPTQNTASGTSNWVITNCATNNESNDYWKMLSGSVLTTSTLDLTGYSTIQIALELKSVGVITANSDNIKVEYWNGDSWSQLGSNLHTTETAAIQTVSLPFADAVAKIRLTAPNADAFSGAGILSVEITGTSSPNPTPTITISDVSTSNLSAEIGASDSETITLSGLHLSADVGLSLSGTNADQFSLSANTIPQSSGTVANTYTTIHYTPNSLGTHVATLSFTTTGFTTINRTINGSASIATGLKKNDTLLILSKVNGNLVFRANKGELLTIYNALGECLLSKQTIEGVNIVTAPCSGFLVVKLGTKSTRIIL